MKRKNYTYLLLLPTIFLNYFTITLIDTDHNLGLFSTFLIFLFNILNIIFVILLNKINFKKLILIMSIIIILLAILDFSYQKHLKENTFQVQNKELGWILNKSIKRVFETKSKKNRKYIIDYTSSDKLGFRYYDYKRKYNKTILILGDSFTVGPYASDDEMYFSEIQRIFIKNNLNYNWYVMGSAGWGTLQQYMYLKKKIDIIKPDILIHQFCYNDFINNSFEIEKNTFLRSQYIFRPYLVNNEIIYNNNLNHKIYKYLYTKSFVFKTIDNLITNKQYTKNKSYFKKDYSNEMYENAINTTEIIIKKIKKLIGNDKPYFIVNCYTKKDINDVALSKIVKNNNLNHLLKPLIKLRNLDNLGEDLFNFDGGHLNDIGNKIYGSEIANEILEYIK